MVRTLISGLLVICCAFVGGCPEGGGVADDASAVFTPGTDGSIGTFTTAEADFALASRSTDDGTEINSAELGGFVVDDEGELSVLTTDDGGTFAISSDESGDLMVEIDDPELGQLSVTVSLDAYPTLRDALTAGSFIEEGLLERTKYAVLLLAEGGIKPASPHSRDLDDFESLDLTTFCQITNACALAELYTELFLDDVVDMIEDDLIVIPRVIIQGRVDRALQAQREFCQDWNTAVFELDDNPCTSSDDPEPVEPEDCSSNGTCNVNCPDTEPDPDCSNAELCAAKEFCCEGDQICDIQRCNGPDPDCTNLLFCDRLSACCDDDDRCDTSANGLACPTTDDDCSFCGAADEVCIEGCTPTDPDCPGSESCPTDDFCEQDCAGEDPDCALCAADATATCVSNCEPVDPDCSVVTNITGLGSLSSSSVFEDRDDFRESRAGDGLTSTNWFSDGRGGGGPDNDSEVFTWTFGELRNTSITRIETDPETFEGGGGFGFASVQVRVFAVDGATVVFDSGSLPMSGFRVDLDVAVPDGVEGRSVVLTLVSHQDSSCGGFSEFRVFGIRDISEAE
ncbi:MAG: hypothetical protein ACPGXK_01885 [Phycisphaerae bacterium]